MRKFAEWVIKYRVGIIVGTVIITAFMVFQLKNLEINSDILEYLPQSDPHVILFNEVGDKFGGNSLAMIALEADDVFSFNTINRINIITQKFKEMPEISYVTSLTDVVDIKKIEGGLEVGKLIDNYDSLADKDELARIKEYVLSKEMYRGNIVSDDGTIAVIVARLKQDVDKVAVGQEMKEFALSTEGDEKLYFAGIPFQMIFLTDIINSDTVKLIPIVLVLLVFTLAVSFRTKRGVILPLATVMVSTTWALGLMSLSGIKLTLASDGMPILLLAIGSAYGIHLVNKYMEDIRKGGSKIESIKDTISEVGLPIFLAGLTTAIGFLAFLTSNLTIIKEFGIFTAIGVLFAFIVSITFLPALLSIMPPPRKTNNQKLSKNTSINRFMKGISELIFKRKVIIVLTGFIICVIGIFSLFNISREVNMVEYFKKDSEIRQAEDMMEAKLGGSIPIQILVKGDLKEPAVLKEMMKLEKYLNSLADVHSPQSIADLICEMNYVMNDRYCIPDTREEVANLWFFFEGNEILPQLINSQNNEGLIQAKLGTVETKRGRYLIDNINKYLSEHIDPQMVSVNLIDVEFSESKKVTEYRIQDILDNISYDATHYGLAIKNVEALRKVLQKYISQDTPINWKELTPNISDKLTDYFNDEESDLIIESSIIREKAVKSITDYVKQNQGFTDNDIVSQLEKVIPVSYYEEDPEMLDYAAMSIAAILKNEIEWNKVNCLLSEITPLISEDLNLHSDFQKNLIGDIWKINDTQIAFPISYYKKLNDQPQSPVIMDFQQTGLPMIYIDIDNSIISSQTYSLIFAIGLVLILLTIQFRSFIGGLISILPIILTVLFNFSIMWIFKIPLDAATVMIGSVAVGIGIDYSIHFNNRFHFEIAQKNSVESALLTTLQTTGKGVIINAFSVMFGFLTLLLGSIVPMQRFGWLIALTMIVSALASITFLPSLLLITHASFLGDLENMALRNVSGIKSGIKKQLKKLEYDLIKMMKQKKGMEKQIGDKKVGLVLGSGSAKGLSHIGVLKFIEEMDIKIDYIAGSSIGAMIGGAYAAGISISEIEDIALKTDLASSVKYFLPTVSKSGLISGVKVTEFLKDVVGDINIEDLKIPFTATATDIFTGQEIIFNKGNLVEAIRASISVPIIFQPVIHNDQILVDGGLANPLPINVACKMGADFIIAVNVMPSLNKAKPDRKKGYNIPWISAITSGMKSTMRKRLEFLNIDYKLIRKLSSNKGKYNVPGLKKVLNQSVYITQRKLALLSIELYRPDILIEPDIPFAGFFDFYKAKEIIDIGYKAAQKAFYENNLLTK